MEYGIGAGPSSRQLLPKIDSRARYAYYLIAALLLLELTLFRGFGFHLERNPFGAPATLSIGAIYSGTMFRRAGWMRISMTMEGIGLLSLVGWLSFLLQYPLIAMAVGNPDDLLLTVDRFMGFEWARFSILFQSPTIFRAIKFAYGSMILQGFITVSILSLYEKSDRCWQLVTAALISLILSVLPLPFFAAEGKYVGCGLNSPNINIIEYLCNYGPTIHKIRYIGVRQISPEMIGGLVSFPSFHAASALLLTWSIWDFKYLRIPSVLLNIFMSIGAIVIAGHYLIDIFGGYVISIVSIFIAAKLLEIKFSQERVRK